MIIQFSKIENHTLEKEYLNTEASAAHKKYSLSASITILGENNIRSIKKCHLAKTATTFLFGMSSLLVRLKGEGEN